MRNLLLILPLLCACPTTATYHRIDEMEQQEYDLLLRRVSSWTHVAAWALIEEGVVDQADLAAIADVFDGVASGTAFGATAVLTEALEANGWQGAALMLFATEADVMLERRGVWGSPRALEIMDTVASAIRKSWVEPGSMDRAWAEVVDEEIAQ